jgi:two-component system LytT family response regulator
MPKINGFEMLELCDEKPGVIFTTAFDEFALKAFEINAIDYLLKPFDKERFEAAIQKWIENHDKNKEHHNFQNLISQSNKNKEHLRIVVKNGHNIRIIPMQEIIYLEAYDDYVKIIIPEGTFLKKQTLGFYENLFESHNFLRVHRSFLLQLSQITKVEPFDKNGHIAILKNGTKLPLSRSGYTKLKDVLGL